MGGTQRGHKTTTSTQIGANLGKIGGKPNVTVTSRRSISGGSLKEAAMEATTKVDKNQIKEKQVEAQQQWLDVTLDRCGTPIANPKSSSHKSWVDIVEGKETEPVKKGSVWDNFDVTKVVNVGFKLNFIEPTT